MSQLFEGTEKERRSTLSPAMKCVTFESSDGFAHRSHCGAVDGLRLDSSLGNWEFFDCPTQVMGGNNISLQLLGIYLMYGTKWGSTNDLKYTVGLSKLLPSSRWYP